MDHVGTQPRRGPRDREARDQAVELERDRALERTAGERRKAHDAIVDRLRLARTRRQLHDGDRVPIARERTCLAPHAVVEARGALEEHRNLHPFKLTRTTLAGWRGGWHRHWSRSHASSARAARPRSRRRSGGPRTSSRCTRSWASASTRPESSGTTRHPRARAIPAIRTTRRTTGLAPSTAPLRRRLATTCASRSL